MFFYCQSSKPKACTKGIKLISSILLIFSLFSVAGLASCNFFEKPLDDRSESIRNGEVPLILPPIADLYLEKGGSKSGRLTGVSAKGISIEGGGNEERFPISNIHKVKFRGEIILRGTTKNVIRGDKTKGTSISDEESWAENIENFKLVNSDEGKAVLKLTSIETAKLRGIQAVALDNYYIVNEIQFKFPNKMEIKVMIY